MDNLVALNQSMEAIKSAWRTGDNPLVTKMAPLLQAGQSMRQFRLRILALILLAGLVSLLPLQNLTP
jgi:hypothetical protein